MISNTRLPRLQLSPVLVTSITRQASSADAIAVVGRALADNKLASRLIAEHAQSQGPGVRLPPQTRFYGVERLIIWLVV
jgi:hypothetical protein